MRTVLAALLVLALCASAPGAKPAKMKTEVDKAVESALEFLANTQIKEEGCWTAGRFGRNVGVTSLCVMAFMSSGHVPGEGKYGKAIEKGVRWVVGQQRPNGLIASTGSLEMYHHGISTLMLAEVVGMVDKELRPKVRAALEKAVALIIKSQRTYDVYEGGWHYTAAQTRSADMSLTGWQVMALRAARNVGCDVPAKTIDKAIGYIKRSQDKSGGFRYMPNVASVVPSTHPSGGMAACTGTAILALELCGKKEHRSAAVMKGAEYLTKPGNLPNWFGRGYFFYEVYYGAQATFQVGGTTWTTYRKALHDALLKRQGATGKWQNEGRDAMYGPNYCTAMAVLALTVEYRYLPIYQRGDEPDEK